jgi:hypothetical protein
LALARIIKRAKRLTVKSKRNFVSSALLNARNAKGGGKRTNSVWLLRRLSGRKKERSVTA